MNYATASLRHCLVNYRDYLTCLTIHGAFYRRLQIRCSPKVWVPLFPAGPYEPAMRLNTAQALRGFAAQQHRGARDAGDLITG